MIPKIEPWRLVWAAIAVAAVALTALHFLGRGERKPSPEVRRVLPTLARYLEVRRGSGAQQTSDGWSWFCGVHYLGNSSVRQRVDLYVFEMCLEYRADGHQLRERGGSSGPAVITLARTAAGYRPIAEDEPSEVSYAADVHRMFPGDVQDVIENLGLPRGPKWAPAMAAELTGRARRQLIS